MLTCTKSTRGCSLLWGRFLKKELLALADTGFQISFKLKASKYERKQLSFLYLQPLLANVLVGLEGFRCAIKHNGTVPHDQCAV